VSIPTLAMSVFTIAGSRRHREAPAPAGAADHRRRRHCAVGPFALQVMASLVGRSRRITRFHVPDLGPRSNLAGALGIAS
jgi:hypothetical protein